MLLFTKLISKIAALRNVKQLSSAICWNRKLNFMHDLHAVKLLHDTHIFDKI